MWIIVWKRVAPSTLAASSISPGTLSSADWKFIIENAVPCHMFARMTVNIGTAYSHSTDGRCSAVRIVFMVPSSPKKVLQHKATTTSGMIHPARKHGPAILLNTLFLFFISRAIANPNTCCPTRLPTRKIKVLTILILTFLSRNMPV